MVFYCLTRILAVTLNQIILTLFNLPLVTVRPYLGWLWRIASRGTFSRKKLKDESTISFADTFFTFLKILAIAITAAGNHILTTSLLGPSFNISHFYTWRREERSLSRVAPPEGMPIRLSHALAPGRDHIHSWVGEGGGGRGVHR